MKRTLIGTLVVVALLPTPSAQAEDVMLPEPAPAPASTRAVEGEPEVALDVDREIDLANVVTSAAKGVTTVQEASGIITIITADEIKARGHKWINEALRTVPGWIDTNMLGNQVPHMTVRGVEQAMLLMRDGVSMFDPWGNVPWLGRGQPLETVKRIEVVTGPGGVLWGANSFLGIVNLISKDAEDVNGLELSAGYGDGPGNKRDFKAYALFGKSFFNGRLKIFQHLSYESYIGEVFDGPQFLVSSPAPQPGGLAFFAKSAPQDPALSWSVAVDGKLSLGPVSLYYMVPFGDNHPILGFGNTTVPNNTWNTQDRYGVLEYKDRYARDRVSISVKGYGIQFLRDYSVQLFPASTFLPKASASDPGGLHFVIPGDRAFRVGGTADLSFTLPFNIRLLGGGELFYEGTLEADNVFADPQDPNLLPLVCPVDAQGNRVPQCPRLYTPAIGRYVAAGYVNAQWRPFQKLTVEGGVRVQKGFGGLSYAAVPLGSAAVVYNFLPDFHVKLNYATGFRPPVLNVTAVPPGGVGYGSNPNLKTESSQSFQGELNARLLRNVRKVRELELRANYSYTVLSDIIQVRGGIYGNSGKRAIQSAEGYGKLYLSGDHFLQASYTYLYSVSTDVGVIRSMPSQWFVVGGSFNLVKRLLDVNMNLMVFGAYQDPNRVPSSTAGASGVGGGYYVGTTTARTSDLAFDRLTPVANLQLGFRLRFLMDRLQVSGQFYNVLNQHYYYPDAFTDLTPTVELSPSPAPGFNFFANCSYRF